MNRRMLARALAGASLPLLAVACAPAAKVSSSATSAVVVSPTPDDVPTLGVGYDVVGEHFLSKACASGTQAAGGQSEASLRIDRSLSFDEVTSTLGVSASGRTHFGVVSASMSASFARDLKETEFSDSTTYAYTAREKSLLLVDPAVASSVAAKAGAPSTWTPVCGHEFVQQIERGAILLINAKFEFARRDYKEKFDASIHVKGPSGGLDAALSQASSQFADQGSVTISVYQQGGSVGRLPTVLTGGTADRDAAQNAVKAFVTCSLSKVDACRTVLANALTYASDELPRQLAAASDGGGGFADLGYVTKPWSEVGVNGMAVTIPEEARAARQRLDALVDKNVAYQARVSGIRASAFDVAGAAQLQGLVDANFTLLRGAITRCYADMSTCGAEASAAERGFHEISADALEAALPPKPAPPPPALVTRHPGCSSTGLSRDPSCAAAIHRQCMDDGFAGGFSQELGDNTIGLACFPGIYVGISLADLHQKHDGCNGGVTQGIACLAATHRACVDRGYGAGIIQEVGPSDVAVACLQPAFSGDMGFAELSHKHPGCQSPGDVDGAACFAAIHRACMDRGFQAGIPQELGAGVVGVACFNGGILRNVSVMTP